MVFFINFGFLDKSKKLRFIRNFLNRILLSRFLQYHTVLYNKFSGSFYRRGGKYEA